MKRTRSSAPTRRGVSLVFVAMFLFVFLGMAVLTISIPLAMVGSRNARAAALQGSLEALRSAGTLDDPEAHGRQIASSTMLFPDIAVVTELSPTGDEAETTISVITDAGFLLTTDQPQPRSTITTSQAIKAAFQPVLTAGQQVGQVPGVVPLKISVDDLEAPEDSDFVRTAPLPPGKVTIGDLAPAAGDPDLETGRALAMVVDETDRVVGFLVVRVSAGEPVSVGKLVSKSPDQRFPRNASTSILHPTDPSLAAAALQRNRLLIEWLAVAACVKPR